MQLPPSQRPRLKGLWISNSNQDADEKAPLRSRDGRLPASFFAPKLDPKFQELHGIFGPPGTGKTTTLLDVVATERARGVPWDQIAFVAFSNAAAKEAVQRTCQRFDVGPRDLPYFRTLHSLCWSLLRHEKAVLSGAHLRDFASEHSYSMSGSSQASIADFSELLGQKATEDDALLAILEWSRARNVTLTEALQKFQGLVPLERVETFRERYEKYRADNDLIDFTDMLENTLFGSYEAPVSVAIVDEAQDLTPLQIAVVENVFSGCARVYIAGDDDQCIYTWAGAEPSWLISMQKRCSSTKTLPKSYRVPAAVHDVAQRLIRQNRARVPKQYLPRSRDTGKVSTMTMSRALDYICSTDKSSFVLARNAIYLRPWSAELMNRGVPFIVEGPAGAAAQKEFSGLRAAIDIHHHKSVNIEQLRDLLDYIPSRKDTLIPRGVKAAVDRMIEGSTSTTVSRCELETMGLSRLIAHVDASGPVEAMTALSGERRQHLRRLLQTNPAAVSAPRITLSTIHRSKGMERDIVVLIPDMSKASYREYTDDGVEGREAEHRVAYVAVTRARDELILVPAKSRRQFPYDDFIRGGL